MNASVMNVARLKAETPAPAPMNARTLMLLTGPIAPTLLMLAWPNVLVMLAQASTGLIETWWVSHLGTDALTGMALVFPGFMMMAMLSAGAVGGGISSAVARALGAGRRADADALVAHALIINLALGLLTSALFLAFGRQLYAAMGGRGGSLEAAMQYSNVVFAGNILVWLMNGLASVVRGTGNMLFPSMVICVGVTLLIPLSPLFIFGLGPMPALGIAGGGVAVVATTALMAAILAWYILSGNSIVRFRVARLRWAFFADILRIGAVGSLSTLQTTLTVALTTGLVGAAAGPQAVAGYGTGSRLEYLLIPLVFGIGAPLVAMVGANIGAGQSRRALRIAMVGGALAFAATEAIGARRRDLAVGVAQSLRRRSDDGGDGDNLSPLRRPDVWVLRPGARALFRLAGRGQAHVAALCRLRAAGGCGRRRLARAESDRIIDPGLRHAGRGARDLWRDRRDRDLVGRVVQKE